MLCSSLLLDKNLSSWRKLSRPGMIQMEVKHSIKRELWHSGGRAQGLRRTLSRGDGRDPSLVKHTKQQGLPRATLSEAELVPSGRSRDQQSCLEDGQTTGASRTGHSLNRGAACSELQVPSVHELSLCGLGFGDTAVFESVLLLCVISCPHSCKGVQQRSPVHQDKCWR